MRKSLPLYFIIFFLSFFLSCFLFNESAIAKQISEVRYMGLVHLSTRDLESVLPFSPGDVWKEDLIEISKKVLTEYYNTRGFYNPKITVTAEARVPENLQSERTQDVNAAKSNANSTQSKENIILTIHVVEGRPCIIRTFWIDDPSSFKSKHVMLRFKLKMETAARIYSGDRYDEVVIKDRLRDLREWLNYQDFILANTEKVRLQFNEDKTSVDVVAAIEYGDRITFGFQGNNLFSKGELNDFIAQLRQTSLGKDFIGLIQRKFIEEYKSRAYNNIQILIQKKETNYSKHHTFFITEGLRTLFKEIVWDGLSANNIQIAKNVFEKNVSRLVQRHYYVEKDIDKGIQLVLEDLKAHGYLASKLVSKAVQPLPTRSKEFSLVHIVIQILEGEQTLIGKLQLDGFSYMSIDKIKNFLKSQENQPLNPFALEEGLQQLQVFYIEEGFLDFKILTPDQDIVTFSEDALMANIQLVAQEGMRIKVATIQVTGLEQTQRYVVDREIVIHPEDWWLGEKVQETELNLRRLGLFADVKIKAKQSSRGLAYRDMIIELKEAEPGAIEVGPGFRSDLGARAFSRISYNNFFGKNWVGALGAEANRRLDFNYRFLEYKLDATFLEPRFFSTKNLYSVGVSTKKQRFPPDFNAVTTQFATGFERKEWNIVSLKLYYSLERIRQFDVFIDGAYSPEDNQTLLIGSVIPSISIDTRDSPFTTTKGQVSNLSLEYANPLFALKEKKDAISTGYYRWTGGSHWYFPVTSEIVWSNVLAAGFERSNIAGKSIPLIKLFRLGGYGSMRGFNEDSINVDERVISGTLAYLNLRTQIDFPLVGEFKFAPFLDAGNLFVDLLKDSDLFQPLSGGGIHHSPVLRTGFGAGIHYLTPIGPINLDYGINLNPRESDPPTKIHFSVGFI